MKKIVFVVPSLSGGGAERVASVLANRMADKGFLVTIVCLLKDLHTYEINDNVDVIFIKSNQKNRLKRNSEKFKNFRKILKSISPDIVIAFTYDCSIITAIATIFIKTKLIISERNDPNNDPSSKLLQKIRNIIYNLADGYVFQTEDAQRYYNNRIQRKSIIIGNPINDNLPLPYEGEREKRIVCVSRLAPQKNIYLLIDSFKAIENNLSEYKVEIYGDGPLKGELSNYINTLNLQDKVILMGYSSNIYNKIKKADIFVIPSNYEGISNSMLEALGLGIPVIATDCPIGGAKTYIDNGKNGYLVEVDNRDDLANKILKLAQDDILKRSFSKEASKIRNILNSDNIANSWISFIIKVGNIDE
ncbi:glycosyltransferase [Clostridium sardiniense]|uniref:Glycosyltransferase n=1 Tax=Clostridium sardiniense TaxID=29369 RepID=A0ABS7KT79_CLOSR|nr:glycosyltransferase [Clostridium sardiniense]MBY0753934.1 glycosyltransferase [Clostridium sardiniense]MDQ0459551.1 glycosyltransferase involved in cell wall biosynthesis [Clostridium sardiniense]